MKDNFKTAFGLILSGLLMLIRYTWKLLIENSKATWKLLLKGVAAAPQIAIFTILLSFLANFVIYLVVMSNARSKITNQVVQIEDSIRKQYYNKGLSDGRKSVNALRVN